MACVAAPVSPANCDSKISDAVMSVTAGASPDRADDDVEPRVLRWAGAPMAARRVGPELAGVRDVGICLTLETAHAGTRRHRLAGAVSN